MAIEIVSPKSIVGIERRLFFAQLTIVGVLVLHVVVHLIFVGTLGTLPFSLLLGALAASLALRGRLVLLSADELRQLGSSWSTTLAPLIHGGIMAGVAYFLFMAGILTYEDRDGLFRSNLFPNFTKPVLAPGELLSMRKVIEIRPETVMDVGKLLVWCFIAGYSEKLVPNVLSTLQRKDAGEAKKAD